MAKFINLLPYGIVLRDFDGSKAYIPPSDDAQFLSDIVMHDEWVGKFDGVKIAYRQYSIPPIPIPKSLKDDELVVIIVPLNILPLLEMMNVRQNLPPNVVLAGVEPKFIKDGNYVDYYLVTFQRPKEGLR